MNVPKLQVALDLICLRRALSIAASAVEGGADWLEVGTPLIKSEGMEAVRRLREKFPEKTIVADMKTMDVGKLEIEIAAKAGANIVCVLGLAEDETLKESIRAGRKYGAKIMMDLIGVKDVGERVKEAEKLGADYLCIHVGIDEQMIGKGIGGLSEVAKSAHIPIAIAGGISSENAAEFIEKGAEIIIVGSAITKAKNVTEATKTIKKAIEKRKKIPSKLRRFGEEELEKMLLKVSSSNLSDVMHRQGELSGILPIKKGYKLVGKALPVRTLDGDWAKPVEAVERATGKVIVVDAGGGAKAVWGELASWSARIKKVKGIVVDGAVRDVDRIARIDFPVFAKHLSPTAGDPKGYGEIGCEIVCGGQKVRNGDWIVGDDDGVVVVPKKKVLEVANRAWDLRKWEDRVREEIRGGQAPLFGIRIGEVGKALKESSIKRDRAIEFSLETRFP